MALSWIDREPGYFALRSEVARLAARARRHRLAVFLGALGVTLGALVLTLRAPRPYRAQLSVRVTEVVEFHLPRSQWTDRELRSYVTDVAFTNQVLLAVYRKYLQDIYRAPNNDKAISKLRDELDVQVARNRIVSAMQGRTGPRSAHVVLRFGAPTAEVAMGVLKELSKPIMETSARRRRDEAARETQRATLFLEQARLRHEALRQEAMASAGQRLRGANGISPVRMLAIQDDLAEAQRTIGRLQMEKDAAERRQRAEKARPGINFDIAEEDVQPPLPLGPLLIGVAIMAFLIGLPLAGLAVGSFYPFVESLEDIRRLGIPTIGRLRNAGGG